MDLGKTTRFHRCPLPLSLVPHDRKQQLSAHDRFLIRPLLPDLVLYDMKQQLATKFGLRVSQIKQHKFEPACPVVLTPSLLIVAVHASTW